MVFIPADPSCDMQPPDFLAFSLIIFLAAKSGALKLKVPNILETIAEDAIRYFLVIFSSHFVLEMTLALGRVSAAADSLSTAVNDIQRVSLGIDPTPSSCVSG